MESIKVRELRFEHSKYTHFISKGFEIYEFGSFARVF